MLLVIGFGELAQSVLTFVSKEEVMYVYNRDNSKVEAAKEEYPFIHTAKEEDFRRADKIFVFLPKDAYQPFFTQYAKLFSETARFYFFATALTIEECGNYITQGTIIPCKCIGQAKQMKLDNRGMLVVPPAFQADIQWLHQLFIPSMRIIEGEETDVLYLNQVATQTALAFVVKLENELRERNYSEEMIKQVLEITTRGVISSYVQGTLGSFGKGILEELKKDYRGGV